MSMIFFNNFRCLGCKIFFSFLCSSDEQVTKIALRFTKVATY
jgi:hypothetical protein